MSHPDPTYGASGRRRSQWGTAAVVSVGFVALLWVIEGIDQLLNNRLDQEGIQPQTADGALGILFAPLLHAGWAHLAANSVPLLVLGFLILLSGLSRWVAVTAIVWIVGGAGTWLVGMPTTIHLGASILIFGWLVYLLLRGLFNGRIGQILLGVGVFLLYGGVLLGVFPGQPGISWQGHLFGAVGGGLAAWWMAPEERRQRPARHTGA